MQPSWRGAATLALVAAMGGVARAHDLTTVKLVNGQSSVDVSRYPTTLRFTYTVSNANPIAPSTVASVSDPLFAPLGFHFTPAPPFTLGVGQSITYTLPIVVASYDQCAALGHRLRDAAVPTSGFTNTVTVGWDSGTAQSSARVTCRRSATFPCDASLYLSAMFQGSTSSRVLGLGALTGHQTPLATLGLPLGALAFNQVDGFLYAVSSAVTGSFLLRLGADGKLEDLGVIVNLFPLGVTWRSGTFLADGTFLVLSTPDNNGRLTWARIDVNLRSVIAAGPLPAVLSDLGDWAFNPLDGKVYAYNNRTHRLAAFDPILGVIADIGPAFPAGNGNTPAPSFSASGAAFTGDGHLLLYGSQLGAAPGALADTLYQVDLAASRLTRLTAPGAFGVEVGLASCPFSAAAAVRPTRNPGFYMTHEKSLSDCLDGGPIALGRLGQVATTAEALALLWSSPALDGAGAARGADEAARVELGRALVAATCNARLFGAGPVYAQLTADAAALIDGDEVRLRGALGNLAPANEAGARLELPLLYYAGPATPAHAAHGEGRAP